MVRSELNVAAGWAASEGWNPGLHDTDVFWLTDPGGFMALEKDGEMIGSVSGVSYNGKFGFGGFFIIKPEYRKKRLGTELANYFLETLATRLKKVAAIGIDGVFNMQPTYSKWGFKFSHRNLRMESKAVKKSFSKNVTKIASEDFDSINKLDSKCFGFNRTNFLKGWLFMPDSLGYKYMQNGEIKGFGVIRKCVKGYKIGPLFASNYEVAHELFKALSCYAVDDLIYLDVPEINQEAMKLAKNYNMMEMFGCARMYLGKAPKIPYDRVFGVTTFELG